MRAPQLRRFLVAAVLLFSLTGPAARANREKAHELYTRGMSEFVLDHYDDAIRFFEEGLREEPSAIGFLYNIASAHRKAGQDALALEFYRKYLERAPEGKERADVEAEMKQLAAVQPGATPAAPAPASGAAGDDKNAAGAPSTAPADNSAGTGAAHLGEPTPAPVPASGKKTLAAVLIAVGAVVVIGGVVTLGVVFGVPRETVLSAGSAR